MLGALVLDKLGVEGNISEEDGFGFLDIKTRFNETKITKQTKGEILCDLKLIKFIEGNTISGYEIHNGISKVGKKAIPFIKDLDGNVVGVCDKEKMVAGTYLHGIFESENFMNLFIKSLKESNDIIISEAEIVEKVSEYKDNEYDKLSELFEKNIDINKLMDIIK